MFLKVKFTICCKLLITYITEQQTFTSGIDIPVDKNGALAVPEDRNQTNCKAVVNIEQADIKLTVDKKQGDSKVVVDGKQAEVVVDQKQADSTKLVSNNV